ncbi:MAG: metallophosphoesterase [Blastochloris sp.]|nr:metallophosphoesterase [Blastochloris sp.]
MNSWRFWAFFGILLSLYGALHCYVGYRLWSTLGQEAWARVAIVVVLVLGFLSYPLGRFLEKQGWIGLGEALGMLGAFWMAGVVYALLGLALLHLMYMGFPGLPKGWGELGIGLSIGVLLIWGHWNATQGKVTRYDLESSKALPGGRLNMVVVSDIHMGSLVNRERVQRLVEEIRVLEPDIVLMPGDLLDEDLAPVLRGNLGALLGEIKARHGVVASTGNHEFIGGVEEGVAYLRSHGVRVLRDEVAELGDFMVVIGREDVAAKRFGSEREERSLQELTQGLDPGKLWVVLDHTPVRLEEAARAGVDLSLSGHTHHGQFWPWNLVTSLMYEVSRGYKLKAGTHVVVSSGYGTWGPPVRIGSRSEIVQIILKTRTE